YTAVAFQFSPLSAIASQFYPLSRRCRRLSVLCSVSPLPSPLNSLLCLASPSPLNSLLCLASHELCLTDLHLLSILYSVSPTRRRPLNSLQWRVSTAHLLEANNTNCQSRAFLYQLIN
ncbi:hypothetical protein HAX54_005642, partial [Datura stramonium]|nr:hypothetical protein [Datura stramonium]